MTTRQESIKLALLLQELTLHLNAANNGDCTIDDEKCLYDKIANFIAGKDVTPTTLANLTTVFIDLHAEMTRDIPVSGDNTVYWTAVMRAALLALSLVDLPKDMLAAISDFGADMEAFRFAIKAILTGYRDNANRD